MKRQILGTFVPAILPEKTNVIIFGEAPGPRGADKTGIPFFGDVCGKLLYQTLFETGNLRISFKKFKHHQVYNEAVEGLTEEFLPQYIEALWRDWNYPRLQSHLNYLKFEFRVALSNVYPICPSDDGKSFRAPKWREIGLAANRSRIAAEIDQLDRPNKIIALGRVAQSALIDLGYGPTYVLHPSPQALARSNKELWKDQFLRALSGGSV